jgi:hypothetical protein
MNARINYGRNQNGRWMVWRETSEGIVDLFRFDSYSDAMAYRDQLLDIFGR